MTDYYDRDGEPISMARWVELTDDDDYRRVASDHIGDHIWVSTVWLGLNHNYAGDGAPLIFETMVFGVGDDDQREIERYHTLEEAHAGHGRIVARLRRYEVVGDLRRFEDARQAFNAAYGAAIPSTAVDKTPANPESAVLDVIDELVNETMAAGVDSWGHPRDNYDADRYPDCDQCPHSWHGLACAVNFCTCEGSQAEVPKVAYPQWQIPRGPGTPYVDQIESVRYTDTRDGRAYALADVEAMRMPPNPQIRFWATGESGEMTELNGAPVWLELMINTARDYVLSQIAQISGLPSEAFDMISPADAVRAIVAEHAQRIVPPLELPENMLREPNLRDWFGGITVCEGGQNCICPDRGEHLICPPYDRTAEVIEVQWNSLECPQCGHFVEVDITEGAFAIPPICADCAALRDTERPF